MGSKVCISTNAFRLFALPTDCLPAGNQCPLKHDWAILLRLQMDYKLKPEHFQYQNIVPLPTDSYADIRL